MIQLTYASREVRPFSRQEIGELLSACRRANDAHQVTGMLLYSEGSFFQVLEGEKESVDRVFSRVSADDRHHKITTIVREKAPRRSFGDWTMGYVGLSREELSQAGDWAHELTAPDAFNQIGVSRAKKLLRAFAGGRWRIA